MSRLSLLSLSTAAQKIAYGLELQPDDDPYVRIVEEAVKSVTAAAIPGAFLVDSTFNPILKHMPEWMPGVGFKRKAREWKKLSLAMLERPYKDAKSRIVSDQINIKKSDLH